MQERKEIKIKFNTALALITILLIIVVVILAVIVRKNEQKNVEVNNTIINNQLEEQNNIAGNNVTEKIAVSEFPIKFLKIENNTENMIYSPLSIKYALKMLNEGADGNTKKQIEKLIEELDVTKYNNIDNVLSLANGVYIRDNYANFIKEDYKTLLSDKYNAEVKYDSFSNANNINNWIENKTLGIIKNMLTDDMVRNPETVMLLINSLAIDMGWETTFDPEDTRESDFYLNDESNYDA